METGLFYAISAAISYGLLQGLEGGRSRTAAGEGQDPRRAFSAGGMTGLPTAGLGVLAAELLRLLFPGAPWPLAALALGVCLAALFCRENSSLGMAGGLLGSLLSAAASARWLGGEGEAALYLQGLLAAGLLASAAGVLTVKLVWDREFRSALDTGVYAAAVVLILAAFVLGGFLPEGENARAFAAVVCGVTGGLLVEKLARLRGSGFSAFWPVLIPLGASLAAFGFYGCLGVAIGAVGMLSTGGALLSAEICARMAEVSSRRPEEEPFPGEKEETSDVVGGNCLAGALSFGALALLAACAGLLDFSGLTFPTGMGLLTGGAFPFLLLGLALPPGAGRLGRIFPAAAALAAPAALLLSLGQEAETAFLLGAVLAGLPLAGALSAGEGDTAGHPLLLLLEMTGAAGLIGQAFLHL